MDFHIKKDSAILHCEMELKMGSSMKIVTKNDDFKHVLLLGFALQRPKCVNVLDTATLVCIIDYFMCLLEQQEC